MREAASVKRVLAWQRVGFVGGWVHYVFLVRSVADDKTKQERVAAECLFPGVSA